VAGLTRRELDGVTVLQAKVSGPLRAVLIFGVGQAHETFPTRGITHLVEHLALTRSERGPHAFNGFTGDVATSFVVAGDAEEVTGYLRLVCDSLRDLPLDRFDHERGVLKTESAQRAGRFASSMLTWRWGPTGYGLMGYDELGLDDATPDTVAAWAAERFTRDNAVLWISGDIPTDLTLPLADAPAGSGSWPDPQLDAVIDLPASYTFSDRGLSFSFLAPRKAEGASLMYLLLKRLQVRLRDELGASYGVQTALERISADTSMHVYFADCLPENATVLQEGVVEVLNGLATDPPTKAEIRDMTRAIRLSQHDKEAQTLAHVDYVARLLLMGGTPRTKAAVEREQDAVTAESIHEIAQGVLPSLLMAVPDADAVPKELAPAASVWSKDWLPGAPYFPDPRGPDAGTRRLLLGNDGITYFSGDNPVTIRFNQCVGMIRFDDGARSLIGADGFHIAFRPEDWVGAADVPTKLDQAIPHSAWISGGQRELPEGVKPVSPPLAAESRWKRWMPWRWRTGVFLLVILCVNVVRVIVNHDSSDPTPPPTYSYSGSALAKGECLLDTYNLDLGFGSSASCGKAHRAEVIAVVVVPEGTTTTETNCTVIASQELTADALTKVVIRSVDMALATPRTLVCVAEGRSELDEPLARRAQ
jgi:predicted Zn-dependent peptidase